MQIIATIIITLFVVSIVFAAILSYKKQQHKNELKEQELNWRLQLERIASGVFNDALDAIKAAHEQELKNVAEQNEIMNVRVSQEIAMLRAALKTICSNRSKFVDKEIMTTTWRIKFEQEENEEEIRNNYIAEMLAKKQD